MNMNSGYDVSQRGIHPTNIKREVGYLGPHEKTIDVGDDQNMVSQESGYEPFWMNPQECVAKNFSQYDEPWLKNKTKAELLGNLKNTSAYMSILKGKSIGELQDITLEH